MLPAGQLKFNMDKKLLDKVCLTIYEPLFVVSCTMLSTESLSLRLSSSAASLLNGIIIDVMKKDDKFETRIVC
jgi:hypothetical protein